MSYKSEAKQLAEKDGYDSGYAIALKETSAFMERPVFWACGGTPFAHWPELWESDTVCRFFTGQTVSELCLNCIEQDYADPVGLFKRMVMEHAKVRISKEDMVDQYDSHEIVSRAESEADFDGVKFKKDFINGFTVGVMDGLSDRFDDWMEENFNQYFEAAIRSERIFSDDHLTAMTLSIESVTLDLTLARGKSGTGRASRL